MSSSNSSLSEGTFKSVGNLIRLLPTGTVFLYQFVIPLLTNNGQCSTTNKVLSGLFIGFCGLSCFFSTFTDSYTDEEGKIHYGIATTNGLWPSSDSDSVDLSNYKLQIGDLFHAFLALLVFGVVSLLDGNTAECFYPSFESTQKALAMALPPVIGAVASTVFALFPIKRHGIGYPSSTQGSASVSTEAKA